MSHANNKTTDKATADATSAFCADFLGDLDTSTDAIVEAGVWEKGSPSGSAMLVVKRGPNAGSRFRLDQPVTSAGRHPDSDIFLDDVSISRRHAEFRRENGDYLVVDTGSLNGTYVNRKPVESVRASQRRRDSDGQVPSGVPPGPRRTDTHPPRTNRPKTVMGATRTSRRSAPPRWPPLRPSDEVIAGQTRSCWPRPD